MSGSGSGSGTPRRRRGLWVFLGVVCFIVVGAIVGFVLVKRQVRLEIERRCSDALEGTCAIDDLSVSPDGATATGIHLSAKLSLATGEIESIAIRFAWWPLVTGESQGVSVRIAAPKIRDNLPVGNIVREARRMGEGVAKDQSKSRVHLDALTIDNGDLLVKVSLLADVHVERIVVDWTRGGRFSLRWQDASFDSLLGETQRTGECKLDDKPKSNKIHIECEKLSTDVDIDKLENLTAIVRLFLKAKK